MEETERPRKLQKLDHATAVSVEDEAILTSTGGESLNNESAARDTENRANPNTTSDGLSNEKDEAGVTEVANGTRNDNSAKPAISKNQLKKQRRQAHWEAGRDARKAKKRQKLIEKREMKRAAYEQRAQASPGTEDNTRSESRSIEPTKIRWPRATLVPVTFIIDCNFDDLMIDRERISLGSQLTRCYSDNFRSPYKAHITISSFNGLLKNRFDTVLDKSHEKWKGITFMEEDYMVAAEKAKERMNGPDGGTMKGVFDGKADTDAREQGEVVYLTSDSPYTLTELKPYSTYVIGGIVDKNRHKGICYKSALDKGVKTAKLPIGDYMQMTSRFVLATNHVVEIMLKWLELGDWGEAFLHVMPKRKGGKLKEKEDEGTPDQEAEAEGQGEADEQQQGTVDDGQTESKVLDTDNN